MGLGLTAHFSFPILDSEAKVCRCKFRLQKVADNSLGEARGILHQGHPFSLDNNPSGKNGWVALVCDGASCVVAQ